MPKDVGDYLESMFAAERERLDYFLGNRTAVYISH